MQHLTAFLVVFTLALVVTLLLMPACAWLGIRLRIVAKAGGYPARRRQASAAA